MRGIRGAGESEAAGAGGGELLTVEGFAARHAFSTRSGGFSSGPYASLNLGTSTGDERELVERNRRAFAGWMGVEPEEIALLRQVHGSLVVEARPGAPQEADAHVSDDPGLLLVISTADCFPLLFHDRTTGAVGAAHCGWRGTVAGIAAATVREMGERFGSRPEDLAVAVGPGICAGCYQVGEEVADAALSAGLPEGTLAPDDEGRWRFDLAGANERILRAAGVKAGEILRSGHCTSCQPDRFYSHRRDSGLTGRHWAAVRADPSPGGS